MTSLSVNVNKIATLRNARGKNLPDVIQVAKDCVLFGADGITVHPRPDERHIRYSDVPKLRSFVHELNVEGNPTPDFMKLVLDVLPNQCTLVPDAPDAITSNAGWDIEKHADFLRKIIDSLKSRQIRVSIFIDPIPEMVVLASEIGADRIELYTESYAELYSQDKEKAIQPYLECGKVAAEIGIGINAGHDLNLDNLAFLIHSIPKVMEVSIGHALVCDALYLGMEKTIMAYKEKIKQGQCQQEPLF